jgi:hypothetical protein
MLRSAAASAHSGPGRPADMCLRRDELRWVSWASFYPSSLFLGSPQPEPLPSLSSQIPRPAPQTRALTFPHIPPNRPTDPQHFRRSFVQRGSVHRPACRQHHTTRQLSRACCIALRATNTNTMRLHSRTLLRQIPASRTAWFSPSPSTGVAAPVIAQYGGYTHFGQPQLRAIGQPQQQHGIAAPAPLARLARMIRNRTPPRRTYPPPTHDPPVKPVPVNPPPSPSPPPSRSNVFKAACRPGPVRKHS